MDSLTIGSAVVAGVGALELVMLLGLWSGYRRLDRRHQQLERLWERHRRAVDQDVAYLHEWQDFLGAYAGEVSEDEHG